MANDKVNFGSELLKGLGGSLGGALGGIPGTIIGSFLSSTLQGNQMEKQFKNQKELMEYQSKLQKDMMQYNWNNQYGAQVQGMKGAGLNPALMQGGSFGLNSAPSVSGGSASALPVQVPSLAENALVASQIKANMAAANKDNADAGNVHIDTQIKKYSLPYYEKLYSPDMIHVSMEKFKADLWEVNTRTLLDEERVKLVQATVDNVLGNTALTEQERKNAAVEYCQIIANIQKTLSDIRVNDSNVQLNKSELVVNSAKFYYLKGLTELAGEQVISEGAKRELWKSQEYLNNASSSNQWSQSILNDAKTLGQNMANELREWDVKYMRRFGEKEMKIRFAHDFVSGFTPVVDNTCRVLDSCKGGYSYKESSNSAGLSASEGYSVFQW